ncbi:unnamed protein product, partial [Amoebophrya sp. A25]|eukprot:GSA25T00022892001.1
MNRSASWCSAEQQDTAGASCRSVFLFNPMGGNQVPAASTMKMMGPGGQQQQQQQQMWANKAYNPTSCKGGFLLQPSRGANPPTVEAEAVEAEAVLVEQDSDPQFVDPQHL